MPSYFAEIALWGDGLIDDEDLPDKPEWDPYWMDDDYDPETDKRENEQES